ncbi:hypothetical protein M3Y99_01249900 [Aphelenchoides fujianensis]|nr:hypothetical protein M3Y99_01249900 [Aphelenchoides fujianensis]
MISARAAERQSSLPPPHFSRFSSAFHSPDCSEFVDVEAAVVKPKPRIRAAVRDGLNRFQLVEKMETKGDRRKGTTQLWRLAAISRAQLTSVRRLAAGIKFKQTNRNWRLRLDGGLGTPKISFPIDQTKMSEITRLLDVPVHLTFNYCHPSFQTVDWEELRQIENHVNALSVYHKFDSPVFSAFIGNVAPQLRVLNSTWDLLAQFPPLDLERVSIYHSPDDFTELNRHKIHRLDVPAHELNQYSRLQSSQVISTSIKSLGILHIRNWAEVPYDSIEAFCRRFPSLEDLQIVCGYDEDVFDLSAYFTKLWAKCLEMRDRPHVAGLKRLFITIKHECDFPETEIDGFEKLKQVEPFHEATTTIDYSDKCVRMFLKHNEPRGPKPTFILIKGNFRWWEEYEEMHELRRRFLAFKLH